MRHGTGGEFPRNSGKRWMGIQFNNTDVLVNVYAGKHDKKAVRLYGGRHKQMLPGLNSVVEILQRVLKEGSYKGHKVQSKWSLEKKLEVAQKQIETYKNEVSAEEEIQGLKDLGIVEKSVGKRKRNSTSRSTSRSRSRPTKKRVLDYTNGPQSGTLVTDSTYTSDEESTISVHNAMFQDFTDVVIDLPPPCVNHKLNQDVHDFTSSHFPLPPASPKPEEGCTSRATSASSIFQDYNYLSDVALCPSRSPSMKPLQIQRKESVGEDGVGGQVVLNVCEPPKYSPESIKDEKSWDDWKLEEDVFSSANSFQPGELNMKQDNIIPDCHTEMDLQYANGFPWNDFKDTNFEVDNMQDVKNFVETKLEVEGEQDDEDDDISFHSGEEQEAEEDFIKAESDEEFEEENEELRKFLEQMGEDRKNQCIQFLERSGCYLQRDSPAFLEYCEDMGNIFSQHCIKNLDQDGLSRLHVLNLSYSYEPLKQKKTTAKFVEIDVSDFEYFWQNYVDICLDEEDEEHLNFNRQSINYEENASYYLNWKRLLDPQNHDGFLFLRKVDERLDWCWNFWIPIEDKHIEGYEIARGMFSLMN